MIIAGSSGSGKSTLLSDIILNQKKLLSEPADEIIYCAKFETSIPPPLRGLDTVTFNEGVPTEQMTRNDENKNLLFCLDDLLDTAFSSEVVSNMFTQGRNRRISVILITQNLFPQFKNARSISLNANYIIVFRNLRDSSSIYHLAKQVCPASPKSFSNMFINNIDKPFSYLFLDFSAQTPDVFRYRSDILADQPSVYLNDEELQKCSKTSGCVGKQQGFTVEFPEF